MTVIMQNALMKLVDSGLAAVDMRDVRGWSPWHQHGSLEQRAHFVSPHDRRSFIEVIQHLRSDGISFRLHGGGTATCKAIQAPVLIETRCLDTLHIDLETQELVVGAGVAIDTAEAFVSDHGWTIGQWLGSGASATIGGSIATRASGILAGRYGNLSDCVTSVETLDAFGTASWVQTPATGLHSGDDLIISARVPLWLSPDGRAVAIFVGVIEPLNALRQIATARLMPAHISLDQDGAITVIVEGEPHLETARYQLIAAILQKHSGLQDSTLEQGGHWESLLSANPWSANALGDTWADRIVTNASWTNATQIIELWAKKAAKAGGKVTWRAVNPTFSGVKIIFDFLIPQTQCEPSWMYESAV